MQWERNAAAVFAVLILTATALAEKTVLDWPDRRPIGQIFICQKQNCTEKDPNGYGKAVGGEHDLATDEGIEKYRKALVAAAERHIRIVKEMNGQGILVWDLGGAAYFQYVGNPRLLPEMSPGFNRAVDDYFAEFRKAGLRTGCTIRPIYIRRNPPDEVPKWGKWGYISYCWGPDAPDPKTLDGIHGVAIRDPVDEMDEQITYAKKRWGMTLFYMDTNNYHTGYDPKNPSKHSKSWTAEMMSRLQKLHPDCLIIPEHVPDIGYYEYVAPYRQVGYHDWSGEPVGVRKKWPNAFCVINASALGPEGLLKIKAKLVQSVAAGDIPFFHAWYPNKAQHEFIRSVYEEAGAPRQ